MKLDLTTVGVSWHHKFESGEAMAFGATEIRQERTATHAYVRIMLRDRMVASDNFNVTRSEDRTRLARKAHNHFANPMKEEYPLNLFILALDTFCDEFPAFWEEHHLEFEFYADDEEPAPLPFVLRPYILQDAGTILFAPPGGGKSYLAEIMGLCIAAGLNHLWHVNQVPVLYINLERSALSLRRRFTMIRRALKVEGGNHQMSFLHARGQSLQAVQRKVMSFARTHGEFVGILDSISRAGAGSLLEDVTANRITDMLNAACPTWLAIGHTPRDDSSHLYGSIHFDAGEDIGVKLRSQRWENQLGLCLEVVKGNDIAFPPPSYYALEFAGENLTVIRTARESEFPKLIEGREPTPLERVQAWLATNGPATTKEIAAGTRMTESNVSLALTKNGQLFQRLGREGRRGVLYDLAP